MKLISVRGKTPKIHPSCFIAENAVIIGDVEIGEGSSVWYGVVIRGDVAPIRIGKRVNIQDNTVVHGTYNKGGLQYGVEIADDVSIGHLCMLHGCTVGFRSLIGMGSIVMDGSKIGSESLIGAGTLVTEKHEFPANSLIVGRPAVVKRELKPQEIAFLKTSADNYELYSSWYK